MKLSLVMVGLALQSILKNKTRATLTMLGIVIGVAAVIVMVAVGYGARSRIRQQIDNLGTNMIVITPGASSSGGVSQGAQAFATLTLADADKIRNESQTVTAVSPVIIGRSQVIAPGGNWRTTVNGVDTDYQVIRDWQTEAGAFFGPDDVRAARGVAVLGRTVAQRLAHFTGWETVISPLVMVVAVGFSGAVGVFFGYYPARKAAALNPIEALRYE
jgi:putative ABC transport system permease protein